MTPQPKDHRGRQVLQAVSEHPLCAVGAWRSCSQFVTCGQNFSNISMMSKARSCWPANMECLLLALLVMNAAIQCTSAGPADPGREDANKKAQSPNQNNKNSLSISAAAEQNNGQSNESQSNKNHTEPENPKETENHKSQTEGNDASTATQGGSKTENKANGGPKAGTKGPVNKKDKNDPKEVELKMPCNKTSDCASFKDTACVADSDGHRRCLCGNHKLPRNSTFCKGIRRYAKFPCSENSQCIANAACKPDPTNTKPHAAHTPDSTTLICWCADGFNFTEDHSKCLDPLSLHKEEAWEKINSVQAQMITLREEHKNMKNRLQKLESSGQDLLPSLKITILIVTYMLVIH